MLTAFTPRDIAKNVANAAIVAYTAKAARTQILQRTDHDPDDTTVKVASVFAGSTAAVVTHRRVDAYIDRFADWLNARKNATPDPEVPTQS